MSVLSLWLLMYTPLLSVSQWMSVENKALSQERNKPQGWVAVTLAVLSVPLEARGAAELPAVVFRRNAGILPPPAPCSSSLKTTVILEEHAQSTPTLLSLFCLSLSSIIHTWLSSRYASLSPLWSVTWPSSLLCESLLISLLLHSLLVHPLLYLPPFLCLSIELPVFLLTYLSFQSLIANSLKYPIYFIYLSASVLSTAVYVFRWCL